MVLNLSGDVQAIRKSKDPRHSNSDGEIMLGIVNKYGIAGWRALNFPNMNELYLEREVNA